MAAASSQVPSTFSMMPLPQWHRWYCALHLKEVQDWLLSARKHAAMHVKWLLHELAHVGCGLATNASRTIHRILLPSSAASSASPTQNHMVVRWKE
mmetsp:Transcript_77780/g.188415  ORF Transcript_77780/g.188415 Transcript_77780/m.188415 type:complete len:96 (-) Transcript_77780:25-312(-)